MLKSAELISLLDLIINASLLIFVGLFIQKNQINSRTLKDYFINEIAKNHTDTNSFLEELEGNINPREVRNKFITYIAILNSVTRIIDTRYKLDSNELVRNLITLQGQIESDINFTNNFLLNNQTKLSTNAINDISLFKNSRLRLFHELVAKINDYSNYNIFKQ